MKRLREFAAQLDGMDAIAIVATFALFFGLCIVFGFGVALIVHGVLGLVFVFGTELLVMRRTGG
ncbi:hypothetical protein OHA25_08565 [Nonomuraea sp. NBC_00507]|uniref:hypothetical protein n=1 Tax=Nonomuraea sp. NBC_00507 TaxID=2976002 RepID=UPI002E173702